jgi:uridine phosphorylase
MEKLKESQLIINKDGSIYHLNLKPENLADTVLLVGDPGRVAKISARFDKIEYQGSNREIITHTGFYKNKRISVVSTGMGPDNIDIVVNELDALANIDLVNRVPKENHTALNLIRIGTSGSIQNDIPIDTFGLSTYGLGMDGLLNFYADKETVNEHEVIEDFIHQTNWPKDLAKPYLVKADPFLEALFPEGMNKGITCTAPGFYAPQGRSLRLAVKYPDLNEKIAAFKSGDLRIINFEMETSALYGLGKLMGHRCLTVCAIIANRVNETYSENASACIERLIDTVLEKIHTI